MINFEFSQIRIDYRAVNSFKQPYFLGSAIRGILGRRLKKIVCIKPREDCSNCEFKKSCPYTIIFETESILNQPSKYVLKPPYEHKDLNEGDIIPIDITLLGSASNYWEFISESLNGTFNLGKDRFIKTSQIYYYHPYEDKYYPVKSFIPRFEAVNFFDLRTGIDEINIKLYPSSIKLKGSYVRFDKFDKYIFLKSLISRISNVAINYGIKSDKIFLDPEKFKIKDLKLKPSPMERWSNRKKKKMVIPAFEGNFKIEGDLTDLYPFIEIIKTVNIGKSVSFGLGKVESKNGIN
ncbi:CRISPR system precrRNA processing endoribonuclease RAMP protein Cas6 [Persephonella sp.]